jgi:hypothetical protein
VLEVNAHPGLHHHVHVVHETDGTAVTVPVVEALLAAAGGGRTASSEPHTPGLEITS